MGGEGEGTHERGGGGVTGKGDGEKRLRGGGKGAHGEGKKRKGTGRRDREEDVYTGGEALHRGGGSTQGGRLLHRGLGDDSARGIWHYTRKIRKGHVSYPICARVKGEGG